MKIVWLLSLTTAVVLGVSTAQAAPIESVESALAKPALQKVDSFLNAQSVTSQLTKLGVTPAESQARLAKLDDAQLAQLATQVDKIQAGGDIEPGYVYPLGPIGCLFSQLGTTIAHVFRTMFCWTDIQ